MNENREERQMMRRGEARRSAVNQIEEKSSSDVQRSVQRKDALLVNSRSFAVGVSVGLNRSVHFPFDISTVLLWYTSTSREKEKDLDDN